MTRSWTCPVCEEPGDACGCGVDKQPHVCGGRWVVRGTRVWVRSVACFREHTAENYPHLTAELVAKVLRWIDAGGNRAVLEDEVAEAISDLASTDEARRLADRCQQLGGDAEALFEEAMAMVRRAVWRAKEVV